MTARLPRAGCVLALLLLWGPAFSGCGSDEDEPAAGERRAQAPEAVIRAWADTLRRGDVRRASSYFSLPAIVQNGTPPLRLRTRTQVRAFNATLPCGARVLRTFRLGRFTAAVFRLTERPGRGRCGSGAGREARTAFVIRAGRITEWRRLADPSADSSPSAPLV